MEYDDDYEVAELIAERKREQINNRYFDYRDPEYPEAQDGGDDE